MSMSRNAKIVTAVVVVLVAAVGAGLFWFLGGDTPDEVSLDAAAESVTTTTAAGAEDASDPEATPDGLDGTWVVDTESGEFDYESATGTFAGFRVAEELAGIGATEAVGRTGDVGGTMTIEGTTVTAASFEIDLSTITTDDSRRDNRVRDALEVEQFPTTTFTLTDPIDLGADAEDGGPVSVTAPGELTIKGVTNSVEFPLEAQLIEDTVVVVGSLVIEFGDYGVEVPSAPIVVSAEERGPIELQLLLVRS